MTFAIPPAQAATLRWTGGHGTSSDWSRGANWDSGTAPANGDTLVFPAGAARLVNDNDLTGLQLASIRFTGASGGYTIGGNGVVVTDSIRANHSAGVNTIALARIVMGNAMPFTVLQPATTLAIDSEIRLNGNNLTADATGFLVLRGVINGDGNVVKMGDGLLTLSGAVGNTFAGDVFVNAGTLFMGKSSGLAVPNRLVIGDGMGGAQADIAGMLADNQVNDVTINSSGLWNLGNFANTISTLLLNRGGDVVTGPSGKLVLGSGVGITVTPTTDAGEDESRISGNLELVSGFHEINVEDGSPFAGTSELVIDAVISGLGAITKEGRDTLALGGANTFAGLVTINAGEVIVDHDQGLGSSFAGTRVNNDAYLRLRAANLIASETLTLNTSGLDSGGNAVIVAGAQIWTGDVVFQRDVQVSVGVGGAFDISGVVSGPGGVTKSGAGSLIYSGANPNTYTGTTFLNAGSVELNKGTIGQTAVAGLLVVGDGEGGAQSDILLHRKPNQVNRVIINSSGLWDLGTAEEEVSELTLNEGGDITTGATGKLRLGIGTDVVVTPGTGVVQDASVISGNLELLLGTHTIDIGEGAILPVDRVELQIDAVVSGLGGITKEGLGDLALTGNNSFSATVNVNSGELRASHSGALGSTLSGTILNNDAGLLLSGGVFVGDETLTLDSTGRTGAFNSYAPLRALGSNTWFGDVVLQQDTRINVAMNGHLTLSGTISGPGGIVKEDAGTLRLAGNAANNTYAGTTFVNEGTLELDKGTIGGVVAVPGELIIGDGVGGSHADVVRHRKDNQVNRVTVNGSGFWDLNGRAEEVSNLVLNQGGDVDSGSSGNLRLGIGADVTVTPAPGLASEDATISGNLELLAGAHIITVDDGSGSGLLSRLVIDAAISGLGAITKEGGDALTLSGANSFAGLVTINEGEVTVDHDLGLGSSFSGTRVNNLSTLRLLRSSVILNEALTLDSAGGDPLIAAGPQAWTGDITLLRDATISVGTGGSLDIGGVISGVGGVTKAGPGTLIYSGSGANSYTGATRMATGRLELNKVSTSPVDAIVGELIIGGGDGGANVGVVVCVASGQIDTQSAVTVEESGRLEVLSELFGSLAGSGRVTVDTALNVGWNNASTIFDGVISGAGSLSKRGSGVLTLNGNNTYTGVTSLVEGGLTVNGQQPASDVTAGSSTTLAGRGRVGKVTAVNNGGILSPGASPGRLTTDDVQFVSGSTYRVELDGPVPGDSHDQVKVNGTVDLDQASLNAVLRFVPTLGQSLVIIDNDGIDAVTDRFAGLQQGDTITLNQIPFIISYRGGDGNDVTLTATNTTISVLSARIEAGNGNGVIEPNECNHLFIALMNETTGPLSVSRVVLDSVTPGVVVTQPFSSYANFPALGIRSNGVPFQFATARDFVCGRLIEFQLTLTVSGGGTFTIPIAVTSGSAGAPVLFNNPANLALADSALTSSTITVSGADPYVGKVAVSLHITHPSSGDLVLRLRSPSGNTVRLAGNLGGAIDNYGNGCGSQAERTTFDDAAATRIAAGNAPFVGSFTPEQPLAAFLGENPNGDWQLLINDTVAGDTGELRCWALLISPPDCGDGGGTCESCVPTIAGTFNGAGPTATQRLVMDGVPSGCGNPKACPGTTLGLPRSYRTHTITNSGPAACISVALTERCPGPTNHFHVAAYLGTFDPANPCANYLGDSGGGLLGAANHFAFQAPADAVIVLVVNELVRQSGCENYTLRLHGLPCPPPTLHISKTANPDEVRLHWSTAYPDFDLQRTPNLNGPGPYPFVNVPTTPTVVNGDYSVTNSTSGRDGYYRLRKP